MKLIMILLGAVVIGAVLYVVSPWLLARRVTFVVPDDFRGLMARIGRGRCASAKQAMRAGERVDLTSMDHGRALLEA